MEWLNAILITAIVAASPWIGKLLYMFASGEVAYAKPILARIPFALLSVTAFLVLPNWIFGAVGVILLLLADIYVPPEGLWLVSGILSYLTIIVGSLNSIGMLIIGGIVFGSLHPKKEVIWRASGLSFATAIVCMLL